MSMPERVVTLSAVGDIMLGDLPSCSGFGVGSTIAAHGPHFPFQPVADELAGSDLVFGNLEAVLSRFDPEHDPFPATHLRAQPQAADGLAGAGFNVLNLANNHIMQHGRAAVLETLTTLRSRNIACTGVEDREAGIVSFTERRVKALTIGFLGYNFRPPQYFIDPPIDVQATPERVIADIEHHCRQVDCLAVSLHWGEEFVDRPSGAQVRQARAFIDAGARIVLGHHPHLLQGIESYRGGVIAYSLGDFVFDLWQRRLRESMILHLNLHNPGAIEYRIKPVWINRNWQPRPLFGAAEAVAIQRIRRLRQLIDPDLPAPAYEHLTARELRRFRRQVYWHYLRSAHRFGIRRLYGNLRRVLANRWRAAAPRSARP